VYKDYDEQRTARKNIQKGVRLIYFLHKRLTKPGHPVLWHCGNCGRPVFEANSDTVEIHSSFGIDQQSIKASDNWTRIKCHSCGAHISLFWK
jgi:DNA-directed RNA polymerase subunit RPC12/RpoP